MATAARKSTKPIRILIVDDEPVIRETLSEFLNAHPYEAVACESGEAALEQMTTSFFDVLICDVSLPGLDGIEVLEKVKIISSETSVLLITAYATVEMAIEAFQKGAYDYLMKPINLHEVREKIVRLMELRDLDKQVQWLRRELHRREDLKGMIVGDNAKFKQALEIARKVARTSSTVLILGESGTGKELMARAVHRYAEQAHRREELFLAVNCAAIPADMLENQLFGHRKGAFTGADRDTAGVFAHAGAGTVFLDEIGELPLGTQAKLLRALEQKEIFPIGADAPVQVQCRIVAATNKNLAEEVERGQFREDLYYRLNVISIELPPLRERRDDIPLLVDLLLAKHARAIGKPIDGVSHSAMRRLVEHEWKGNIRELDNVIQRAVILGDGNTIMPCDLPSDIGLSVGSLPEADNLIGAVEQFERQHIERILRETPDKREAAKRLGIGLSSLYRKLESLTAVPG